MPSGSSEILIPQGTSYQITSSYDCVATHSAEAFNLTTESLLSGGINSTQPGVTLYVATAQAAQTIVQGHPSVWIYSSGLTSSTSFSITLAPGSYVFWMEGADLNCGATIVMPLEQLTTVTIVESVVLTPL